MPMPYAVPQQGPAMLTPEQLAALQAQPVVPPPTPASAGFAAWAADAQNGSKVANSLVPPGQSIMPPNAPQMGQQAAQQATQSSQTEPAPFASAFAPVPSQGPAIMPPAPVSAAAAPTPAMAAPGTLQPSDVKATPDSVTVSEAPLFPTQQQWAAAHPEMQAKPIYAKAGSGWHGVLQDALNIGAAGLAGAAGGIHGDPTAGVRLAQEQAQYDRSIPDVNQQRYLQSVFEPAVKGLGLAQTQADIDNKQANTAYTKQKPQLAQDKISQAAAKAGQTVTFAEDGSPTFADNPDSQEYKDRVALNSYRGALEDRAAVQAEIQANQYKPGTPEYERAERKMRQVDQRLGVAYASLGMQRARLGQRQEVIDADLKGTLPDGTPVANAPVYTAEDGTETLGGLKGAAQASKNQGNVARFKDVYGALDSADSAAEGLARETGGTLSTPGVIAALSHGKSDHGWVSAGVQNYLRSGNAASLTPRERDYVLAVTAAHENVQAMRSSVGGGVSDSQVNRLEEMMPGASTPDINYFKGQTGQIRSTANRLGTGVVGVGGGNRMKTAAGVPPAPGTGQESRTFNGHTYARRKGSSDPWHLQ